MTLRKMSRPYWHQFQPRYIIPIIVVVTMSIELASTALTIKPVQLATEVGDNAVFVCIKDANTTNTIWTFGTDNTSITTDDQPNGRVTSLNGTLTIQNVTENDQGKYYCSSADAKPEDAKPEAKLIVYVMPDYVTELVSLGVFCLVFLVILGVLVIRKQMIINKQKKVEEKKEETWKVNILDEAEL